MWSQSRNSPAERGATGFGSIAGSSLFALPAASHGFTFGVSAAASSSVDVRFPAAPTLSSSLSATSAATLIITQAIQSSAEGVAGMNVRLTYYNVSRLTLPDSFCFSCHVPAQRPLLPCDHHCNARALFCNSVRPPQSHVTAPMPAPRASHAAFQKCAKPHCSDVSHSTSPPALHSARACNLCSGISSVPPCRHPLPCRFLQSPSQLRGRSASLLPTPRLYLSLSLHPLPLPSFAAPHFTLPVQPASLRFQVFSAWRRQHTSQLQEVGRCRLRVRLQRLP